jgi:hypothetical protein
VGWRPFAFAAVGLLLLIYTMFANGMFMHGD